MNLPGKMVVVTRANSGLEAALSGVLVAKEAIVYGLSRNKEKFELQMNHFLI